MANTMRVVIFGDIVGTPGRVVFQKYAQHFRNNYNPDMLIVNGENSSSTGRGITPRIMRFLKHNGASVVTSGNHIFAKKEIYEYLDSHDDLLRPLNFPNECPGKGVTIVDVGGIPVGVINVQGRIYMREMVSCPFKAVSSALTYLRSKTNIIIMDHHTETTSEASVLGYHFDGSVSICYGTHTHIQTADARILPNGTGYITDAGMAGSLNSILGMERSGIIYGMQTQMPVKFKVETEPPYVVSGIIADIDTDNGTCAWIEPFRIVDHELSLDGQ